MVLYAASTSLPYLASSPTADPRFGELNRCLIDSLQEPKVGFAASADGRGACSYGAGALAVCWLEKGDGGERAAGRRFQLPGVTAAAFDFAGALWLATGREAEREGGLWRLHGGEPARIGDIAPIALSGHSHGVAALDVAGRLLSLSGAGDAMGFAQLPSAPVGGAQLASNSEGTLLSVVAGTGLFLFRAQDLRLLRAEGPCQVEYLWWSAVEASRALVSCAPRGSWALLLQVESGEKEAAPRRQRTESALLPKAGIYVHACEGLPCSAPEP